MSIMNYLFDNEWRQRSDIEQLRSQASSAEQRILWAKLTESQLTDKLQCLEGRLAEMNLVVETLVRIVVARQLTTPKQLADLMRQIDLEDGEEDGQLNEQRPNVPEWCPKCEARIGPGKLHCVFCGLQLDDTGN